MSGRGRPNPRGGRGGPPRGGRGGRGRGRPTENPSHDTRSQAQVGQITQQVSHMTLNTSNYADDGTSLYMPQAIQAPTAQHVADGNKVDTRAQNQQALSTLKPAFGEDFPFRKVFAETKTTVFSNHFAIGIDPNTTFYEYDIHGIPSKMAKAKAKSLVQAMIDTDPFLKEHQHEFATDYLTRVISWVKLPPLKPISISLGDRGDPMQLELQLLGTVDIQRLQSHTTANTAPEKPLVEDVCNNDGKKRAGGELGPVINAVNILISTAISDGSVPFKANKFFVMGGHKTLGSPNGSLCTIRGYYYTIKPGMGQILLNLNACTSAFFRPILVSDFLNDQSTFPIEQDREDALQGLRVFVEYERGGKNDNAQSRTKIIAGTGKRVSQQTFERRGKDGAPATFPSVQAYLKDAYNLVLKHPSLPTINVGTYHNPTWFAPEHLRIVPYQIYKRPVPEHLTSGMLDEACRKPENSRALIEHEGLKQLGIKAGGGLVRFSKCPAIQIDPRMIRIPSGKLQYPKIQYRSGPISLFQPAWNLKDTKFLQSRPNAQFRVYALLDGRLLGGPNTTNRYLTAFHEFAQKTYATGIYQLCGSEIFQNPAAIPKAMKNAQDKGANFTLLILKQKSTIAYSTFKDLADRTYGMHSLCITEKPNYRHGGLNGNLAGYFGNVMMKVNLKAGGINHTVDRIADIMKDTLVLGADVTHPGPGALLGTPSIAAIVGSVDKTGGKFLGSMRLQPKEAVEMIKDVESMVLERINDWSKCNGGALPKSIIYYRDGVSEGQFVQVKDLELPQIGKAYAKAAAKRQLKMAKFKLTAITVMKRHHVRFYPLQQDAAPSNRNCQPGTLVDSVVTSPFYQDFYLQSHNGLKGTAKPAHYFVLVNEMGLSENAMQSFTHNLCYTYVRATLGVSYAPPAYYADRLCERGRCYLRQFFVAGPEVRKDLDNLKVRLQLEKKEKREKQFKPLRTQVGKGYWQKSDKEKYQEDEDKKEIEALLKLDTLEKAKKAFYPGGVVGNPWKESIAGTMFWM